MAWVEKEDERHGLPLEIQVRYHAESAKDSHYLLDYRRCFSTAFSKLGFFLSEASLELGKTSLD